MASEPIPRTSRRTTLGQERPTPIDAPLSNFRERSTSLPAFNQPPSPPLTQRSRVLDGPKLPVSASAYDEFVPRTSSPEAEAHLDHPWVSRPPSHRSSSLPAPRASTPKVPSHPRSRKGSLAPVKETSTLDERLPYIPPVVRLFKEFTTQNEVKQHHKWWDAVDDKLEKVSELVSNVEETCVVNDLEENDLPHSLPKIFRSLKSQLDLILRARKQSENVGVIKRVFVDTPSQREVEAYGLELSNVLEKFQAALAFNPHFKEIAAKIEVKEVTNVHERYDEGQTPLHVASQLGWIEAMRWLIEHRADTNAENEDGETPLFLVCRNGDEKATALLLRRSASVGHQDREKRTPLHEAAENGHDSVTKLLLKFGANPNAKNVHDWTPLHLASRTGKIAVVKILVQWHADVNAQNDFRSTPLHIAAQKGHADVVKHLLRDKNAKVDSPDALADTALHLAAYYGYDDIVGRLINYGADVSKTNKEGKTALDVAKKEAVVQLLLAES